MPFGRRLGIDRSIQSRSLDPPAIERIGLPARKPRAHRVRNRAGRPQDLDRPPRRLDPVDANTAARLNEQSGQLPKSRSAAAAAPTQQPPERERACRHPSNRSHRSHSGKPRLDRGSDRGHGRGLRESGRRLWGSSGGPPCFRITRTSETPRGNDHPSSTSRFRNSTRTSFTSARNRNGPSEIAATDSLEPRLLKTA